ncbi:MAG: hypothetical protein GC192_09900 [Bacteroidetes bacterium]|nr:hypothetical protein [Bacteroidota bacterium]
MKTQLLCTFFCLASMQLSAQNAWNDAVQLRDYFEFNPDRYRVEIDNSQDDEVGAAAIHILANYCQDLDGDGTISKSEYKTSFEGNPFISQEQIAQSLFNLAGVLKTVAPDRGGIGMESEPSAGGALAGGNFITRLADGLAIFIVKRTKEELNATFFEGLRKKMEEEPAYRSLFPATYDLLYIIGNEIYNYNAYIKTLRESFINDLNMLPLNFEQFIMDNQLVKKQEFQIALEDLVSSSQMIMDGEKPMQMLDFIANEAALQDSSRWLLINKKETRAAMQDLAMSLKILQLLTVSLTQKDSNYTWVEPNEVKRQMGNLEHVYIYLGLLWQQGINIKFSNGTDFRQALGAMATQATTPLSIRNYLVSLVQTVSLLEQSGKELLSQAKKVKSLKNIDLDSLTSAGKDFEKELQVLVTQVKSNAFLNDEYVRFAGLLFDFYDQARGLRKLFFSKDNKPKINNPKGQSVDENEPNKPDKPSKIVMPELPPIDQLERQLFSVMRNLFDLEFNIRQGHYTTAVTNLTGILTEILQEDDFKYKKQFLRHVNFMATVAEARDAKEIEAAIELFALPPGSSRMKKQSPVSVSLNSYGGIAYGWEHDINNVVDAAIKDSEVLSTSAPLGIDLNFGLGDQGSLSFFTQAIDVGALFAYRFSNETEQIPELKFQNIIAPGFYGIYGFPNNIPVSIGIGAQLGPNLRKVRDDLNLDVETTNAWRFGFILSVDIPITHFYTK